MPNIPMPKDGKGPMMGANGGTPMKPAEKIGKIAAGQPTKGSGSDTSPYSAAGKGRK